MQTLEPTTTAVDSTLATVLARPEFAPPPPGSVLGLLVDGLVWIWERLGDLAAWLLPETAGAEVAWQVAGRILLLLMAVAALMLLARAALPAVGRLRGSSTSGPAAGEPKDPLDASGWEERARSAAAEGRWREASVCLYRAVIVRLSEERHVRPDPAKTPGDYRREIRGRPPEADLDSFLRQFEPVAFGRLAADRGTYERLANLASALGARA